MYYIDIATGTRVSIYAIRTLHPHMSIPDGADLADLGYAPIVLDSTPLLAPGESYAPGQLQQEGSIWRQTWVILPPPDPAILIAEKTEMLWTAADRYTSQYISGGAFGMLAVGMMLGKPKCISVAAWSGAVWQAYYDRKELITTDSTVDHDFSSFGPIPHTVPELRVETGM